jgi:hypothetical protein
LAQQDLSDLDTFAREQIAAERYPNDAHFFRAYKCDTCGVVPFELTIETHSGSKRGDFKGVIWGDCTVCGTKKQIFSFTGNHRQTLRQEKPTCICGYAAFVVAECERIERDDGMLGFFDEGVVVGKCAHCGRKRAFVHTD